MINQKWIDKTKDYKSFVGNPKHYDKIGKIVFNLLLGCGLKPHHKILDIGCGSLRSGRHVIKYLNIMNYYGLDPNYWLIRKAINNDKDILVKRPFFNDNSIFNLNIFETKFDFILANSIFIHAAKSQIEKVFSQINDVLKDTGIFIFNYIIGNKDNNDPEWTYPSHICYTQKYIEDLLNKYSLRHEIARVNYPGKQTFIIARKK